MRYVEWLRSETQRSDKRTARLEDFGGGEVRTQYETCAVELSHAQFLSVEWSENCSHASREASATRRTPRARRGGVRVVDARAVDVIPL